ESIFGMAFRKEINNIECPCIYKILNNNQLSGVVWKIINSINTKSIQSHVLDQNIVNNDDSKHELTGLLYRTNLISLLKIYDIINFQIIPKIKQCPVKQEIIMSNNIEYNQNKIFVKQINQKLIEFNHIFPILRICYVILTEKHFKLNENVNNIATNLLSNDSTLLQEIKKIKIVQFEKKIGEQIGITLKHDRNHNCLISRILCGGKVYNQDILKAHDQILEINNVSVKNKNLEMIQNMLVNTNGSITIKILPYLRQSESKLNIYVKALYNYDPYDDEDHPCPEAGIYFLMGHILHIVNQDDQDWWQACIVNNQSVCSCQQDESTKFNFKVGVIPSELFLKSKISTKSEKKPITNSNVTSSTYYTLYITFLKLESHGFFKFKQKKSNIPILKPVNIKDRYRVQRDDPNINFYKEVVWCKSFSRKTIILIGPHGVGRRHIKNTLIAMKPWKYSYPIPHTTRDPRLDEMNGTNYYFISQSQMINDIKNNEYLEFGTLTECIYGTKLETIRQLCDKKIIPIIDVEPNAIKLLYNSDFCPLIVFIAAPTHSVFNEDDSLKNLLKESYEIEMNYGHYFDVKIENSDIDETIETIQTSINNFFNKPQWIPIEWNEISRPLLSVYNLDGSLNDNTDCTLPDVFKTPIRPDIVRFVHSQMLCNKRQPYAVSHKAGVQCSATSWGTGRAMSRIPRIRGSGTHRSGQGAYGNMCNGGHMFAPTKVWRRWYRKINVTQKRYALVSSIAGTAIPALVMSRGHKIDKLNEVPLVVSNDIQSVSKTRDAIKVLKALQLDVEMERVKKSKTLRAGKGKMRNRRYKQVKGPCIIYKNDFGISKGFRNIPGVSLLNVDRLNLLELSPGGHLGRLCVWTQSAMDRLHEKYQTVINGENSIKNFKIPSTKMTSTDLKAILTCPEILKVLRPKQQNDPKYVKVNPLNSTRAMDKLNPYAIVQKRSSIKQAYLNRIRNLQLKSKVKDNVKTTEKSKNTCTVMSIV
ncbi:hypothetical protein A3Q56_06143, partial [Intoshia linei]